MKKHKSKKKSSSEEKKDFKSNIIKFSGVTKTKNGYAIWVGPNVIFLNQGLLDYIKKQAV